MEYRLLGDTGLKVSAISFGNMTFDGHEMFAAAGQTQLDEAKQIIDACIDAGINMIDTADIYSFGKSEEMLGKTLKGRRDKVLIATKCHFRMSDDVNDIGQSRHNIVRACEASLRRLGTDYIDIYQMHNFDSLTNLEHTMKALDDLVRSGKVRYIGCSNFPAWSIMKANGIADRRNFEKFVSLQAYYSMVARELEHEFVPMCESENIGILVWGPLAGGFLTGKHQRGKTDPNSRRAVWGDYGSFDEEHGFAIVDELKKIAANRGVSAAQVALNYMLHKPAVTSLIIGARRLDQLKDCLNTVNWKLTEEEFKILDQVSATPLPYPYWHHKQFNNERMPLKSGYRKPAEQEKVLATVK